MLVFTLKYDGLLFAHNDARPRAREKNRMRVFFHGQLAVYWDRQPRLKAYAAEKLFPAAEFDERTGKVTHLQHQRMWKRNFQQIAFGKYSFIPLVSTHNGFSCRAEVTLLRRGGPRGDLDNVVKTVFDGLRMPRRTSELEGLDEALGGPLYCVLEDDAMIDSYSVDSGDLLLAGAEEGFAAVTVRLSIAPPPV